MGIAEKNMKFNTDNSINSGNTQQNRRISTYIPPLASLASLFALAYYLLPVFNTNYPRQLLMLTLPYCLTGAGMALSLAYAIRHGYWVHAALLSLGIIFICGIA